MTSFQEAQAKGLPWPAGPDDLRPGKQQFQYLYAGGLTRKAYATAGVIWATWFGGIYTLDKWLLHRKQFRAQNAMLEKVCMFSTQWFVPTFLVLFVGIPGSRLTYDILLKIVVGIEPVQRETLPKWKPGESPFTH